METILVIEDDPVMQRGLIDNFEYQGYRVYGATDGETGLNMALELKPDLILLDIMLPVINGYEICRLIRKEELDMPIIMLTAKGQESDIILGLNLGADDYVTKPFSIRELLARVEAFLRRRRSAMPTMIEFGSCQLNLSAHTFFRNGVEESLSPREYKLLELFVQKPNRALTRNEILNWVWGYDSIVTSRTIDRFINTLRNKVEPDPRRPSHIITIREVGYKFILDP